MNKRKIVGVTVFFEDGEAIQFNEPGTFSESINARKKGGFANLQEWVEYHITWVIYRDSQSIIENRHEIEEPTVEKADREQLRGMAWCSQHGTEPHECFALHNPATAFSGKENDWKEEVIQSGKEGLMRAYGLTEPGLKKWIDKEDSVWAEFNISDLEEGYGNGHV